MNYFFHPVPPIRSLTTVVVLIMSLGTTSVQAGTSIFSDGVSFSELSKTSTIFGLASWTEPGMVPALYRMFQEVEPSPDPDPEPGPGPKPGKPDPDPFKLPGRMPAVSVDLSASLHNFHTITWHWSGKAGLKLCAPQSFQLFQVRDDHGHSLLIIDSELSDAGCCYKLASPDKAGQASIYLDLDNLGAIDWQRSALRKGEHWLPLAGIVPQSVTIEGPLADVASFSPGLWLKPQQESEALLYLDSTHQHEITTGPDSGIIQYGQGEKSESISGSGQKASESSSGKHGTKEKYSNPQPSGSEGASGDSGDEGCPSRTGKKSLIELMSYNDVNTKPGSKRISRTELSDAPAKKKTKIESKKNLEQRIKIRESSQKYRDKNREKVLQMERLLFAGAKVNRSLLEKNKELRIQFKELKEKNEKLKEDFANSMLKKP